MTSWPDSLWPIDKIIWQTDLNIMTDSQDYYWLIDKIIQGVLELHTRVSATFRKTAANFHYEFNMRHLASVFKGRARIYF